MTGPREQSAREHRQALPVAICAMLAVVFLIGSLFVAGTLEGGDDGQAELLRQLDAISGRMLISAVLMAIGFLALAPPLAYLFQAAIERRGSGPRKLIWAVWASPVLLAGAVLVFGLTQQSAASDFVALGITGTDEAANEAAEEVMTDRGNALFFSVGLMLAGAIGFSVSMAYTSFQAMKVGLLAKLPGSAGTALGVVAVFSIAPFIGYQPSIFSMLTFLWFIYLGLLIAGWIPGGRPPAWAAGRAIPWPRPGEKFAEEHLSGPEEVEAEVEIDGSYDPEPIDTSPSNGSPTTKRKRKRRS